MREWLKHGRQRRGNRIRVLDEEESRNLEIAPISNYHLQNTCSEYVMSKSHSMGLVYTTNGTSSETYNGDLLIRHVPWPVG